MSLFARIASLHPLIVTAALIGAFIAVTQRPDLVVARLALPLVMIAWTLGVYVTARQATSPAPLDRYPKFARIVFALALIGLAGASLGQPYAVEPIWYLFGAIHGVGMLAWLWVVGDALIKAETGKPWLAGSRPASAIVF